MTTTTTATVETTEPGWFTSLPPVVRWLGGVALFVLAVVVPLLRQEGAHP